jgi:hypothetical protein
MSNALVHLCFVHILNFQSSRTVSMDRILGVNPHPRKLARAHTHAHPINRMFASGIMQNWNFMTQQKKVSMSPHPLHCYFACLYFLLQHPSSSHLLPPSISSDSKCTFKCRMKSSNIAATQEIWHIALGVCPAIFHHQVSLPPLIAGLC